jgi:glycosyltransferase involved in cell wall biosynthesis
LLGGRWELNIRQTLRNAAGDHLEFTQCCPATHLLIIKRRLRLLMVEKVVMLSVIVPFFNVERYAAENLRSLVRNAAPGIEFVLVDDGSTDATSSIISDAAERLPGAQLVRLQRNSGLSAARNAGLSWARGRYLSFLDGDDVAAPCHFSALVEAIERLGCDFVRTDHVQVHGRQRLLQRVSHAPRGVVCPARSGIGPATQRSSVDAPYAWAGIYHRRLLDAGLLRFDEDLRTCEDRPWIWGLHLQASTFAVVGLYGVRYRRDVSASLTQLVDERQLDFIPAFERIVQLVYADRNATSILPKVLRAYCAVVCHHLNQCDRYPPALQRRLRAEVVASLALLPTEPLQRTIAELDVERAATVQSLLLEAA